MHNLSSFTNSINGNILEYHPVVKIKKSELFPKTEVLENPQITIYKILYSS